MAPESPVTMRHFIRRQLIIAALLLSAIFGYALFSLYEWGLDDASEYYLYDDAKQAESAWLAHEDLPGNTSLKQFYLDQAQLPARYHALFKFPIAAPALAHMENAERFDYVLAYPLRARVNDANAHTLFVVHSFVTEEDNEPPGMSVTQVFGMLVVIAVGSAALLAGVFLRKIGSALRALRQWVESVEETGNNASLAAPPATLRFEELHDVGAKLHAAITRIRLLTEREKSFVRCLSHELRTPMAIVCAALDLIEKRNIPPEIASKISKIRDANGNMINIADTLLRLWGDEEHLEPATSIELSSLINHVLAELALAGLAAGATIHQTVAAGQELRLPRQVFSMVLTNLIKNALQYSRDGSIFIEGDASVVVVRNPVDTTAPRLAVGNELYGFGLGLFIVDTLAGRYGWQGSYCIENGYFVATLKMGENPATFLQRETPA